MTPAPPVEDDVVRARGAAGAAVCAARPPRPSVKKVITAFIPLGVLGLLVLSDIPLCPTKNFLGIPCPGCGLTRATEALVVGDLWTVLLMHPLAPIITPMAVYSLSRTTLVSAGLMSGQSRDLLGMLPKAFWVTLGVSLVGLWVARISGLFGGHPDTVDFTQGWIARGAVFLRDLVFS